MSPWLIFGLVWLAGMIGFVAGFLVGRAFGYDAGWRDGYSECCRQMGDEQ